MSFSNISIFLICFLCGVAFGLIAIWSFRKKDPMHFWAGSTVRPEEITDIVAYNRANGVMWCILSVCIILAGIVGLFDFQISLFLSLFISTLGLVILSIAYQNILKKYRNPQEIEVPGTTPKTPGAVLIGTLVFVGIVCILVGVTLFYGQKDPEVVIQKGNIQIEAMYGTTINANDIKDISLIEKSMNDIGVDERTNGFGGFGGSLKGDFKSEKWGKMLLFVQADTSPTIKIERSNDRDVYISFRNSNKTKEVFQELKKKTKSE